MSDEQHLAWLRQRLSEYEAEAERARALAIHTRALIDDIEAHQPLAVPTNEPVLQPQSPQFESTTRPPAINLKPPSKMPPRRPEYHDMTTVAASLKVIERELRPWHVDELVIIIFEVDSKQAQGFDPAKRVVSSELIRAARDKKLLQQLGGNFFASNNFIPQHNNGLPTASPPLLPTEQATEAKEVITDDADWSPEREQHT